MNALLERGTVTLPGSWKLDCGRELTDIVLGYESWGTLNRHRDNAVIVCHSLTKGSHAASHHDLDTPGWWERAIGPGRMIDTDHYCVIAFDALGSGRSTGPSTLDRDDEAFGSRWPRISVHDIVTTQLDALERLNINRVRCVIGGCFGGQQAIQWAIDGGNRVEAAVPIAVTPTTSPHSIAIFSVMRCLIASDPLWAGGDYDNDHPPLRGLGLSVAAAIPIWMSKETFDTKFARTKVPVAGREGGTYAAELFVEQLAGREQREVDARGLFSLTHSVDDFDLTIGPGLVKSLAPISARLLVVGYTGDWRYPPEEVRQIDQAARVAGVDSRYVEVESNTGHGGFMYDVETLEPAMRDFMSQSATRVRTP